jgi:signal peptidase I
MDLNTEIAKYTAKVSSAEQAYTEFNEKTKGDIIVNRYVYLYVCLYTYVYIYIYIYIYEFMYV